jgi:hypothetical protein
MIVFITTSFYVLVHFVQGKKELETASRSKKLLTQREFDLQEEHDKIMQKLIARKDVDGNIGSYDIKPIPRPKE